MLVASFEQEWIQHLHTLVEYTKVPHQLYVFNCRRPLPGLRLEVGRRRLGRSAKAVERELLRKAMRKIEQFALELP